MDCSSNLGDVRDLCGDKEVESERKAFHLQFSLPSLPHRYSSALGNDQKKQTEEINFLCGVAGLTLRERARSSDIRRELGGKLLLFHIKRL